MEDRLEAHKLLGMKTAQKLTSLCWSLSRPELLSGPLITRRFIGISDRSGTHMVSSSLRTCLPHSTDKENFFNSIVSLRTSRNSTDLQTVKVMQWNVLSQAIGFHCDNFATCPKEDILWSARKYKILFEIAQYSPDIICLQEVDRFYFIHKILQKVGFDGLFHAKPDSGCLYLPENTGPDGVALFYNTSRFVLLRHSTHILRVQGLTTNQVALVCTFRC